MAQHALGALLLSTVALGTPLAAETAWRRIGGTGIAAGLAGPAGAPAQDTWFSAGGGRLLVSLPTGGVWSSADEGFTWAPDPDAASEFRASLEATPSPGGTTTIVRNPYRAGVSYRLARHLYRSDDGGLSWTNLTLSEGRSVIGPWQSSLAISPTDAELIVVGNSHGLWKSQDAGVTWASLNSRLPNFPRARFLNSQAGGAPELSSHLGTLALARLAGPPAWSLRGRNPDSGHLSADSVNAGVPSLLPDSYSLGRRVWRDGRPISPDLTGCRPGSDCADLAITATSVERAIWAGTSDGRIWLSLDQGSTWKMAWDDPSDGPVTSLWADPHLGQFVAAIVGSRVLRSSDGGNLWIDVSADLPEGRWTSVIGHPETGALYVAGSHGVFSSRADFTMPLPPSPWTDITGNLPSRTVTDLAVDRRRGRLYIALAGHGIHWAHTPAVRQALQALSAADLAHRPAAPGGLLTILGVEARSVRASGQSAPVLHTSRGRTQVQLPFTVQGRTVQLQLQSASALHELDLPLREASPAIFVVGGDPLVLDARSGSVIGWAKPAAPGSSVLAMMAGLGAVEPTWPAGLESPQSNPPAPVARLAATVNGVAARVVASQLAPGYVGTYVVEVEIPSTTRPGQGFLTVSADGMPSNEVALVIGQ